MSSINKFLFLVLIVIVLLIGINLMGKSSNEISQTKSSDVTVQPQQNKLAYQENKGGNVTVTVKPKILKVGEKPIFDIEFNTHSVDLTFDIPQVIILADDKGNVFDKSVWNGNPPGGHHRSGVLTFNNPLTETKYVELVMTNIAQVPERGFKWEL
ncbi:hypothetical protein A3A46_03385 [Candidatus Roizmanbacteria bacterium RIFCSPLOWO2_01_FULL_37_13]|uniref:DUF4352 domain-containing protein n=1 Tax=Candidatus Roizmanbacteria bacterium RIFCSPHIGHO2_02_FULL_38_11 TaxID=1802039 RepID=A0A1F7GWV0_9BACT|nr:MAG: hypothetical protein A3C25_02220 [Candidatus Roizmanbacteria bacterium RIFCSPHIGHO2_02_FULL_38_11]OGK33687.1 MAG: hypothetical protein A3F58_02305 [Candidatus Roizmanbacteria bacterium RIFCSPHIGHO2_12_FULL_37_9b]OGK43170.1 MAG: hypothetical protein A3A46_03385 [Candidatus Roizmanbacteria bacterium RIFCSPLOWO2_01_FULL_37_13]